MSLCNVILLAASATVLLADGLPAGAEPRPEAARPNILWITSEDNGRFLGCYGDPAASTPNLDRLAAEGVRFTKCYANAPVCAVARNSWILGVPAVSTGAQHMRSEYRMPDHMTPYPSLLRGAGYFVTNNAKTDYNTRSFGAEIWDECGPEAHYKNRPPGKPFFAVFNIEASHESRIFEEGYRTGQFPPAKTAPGRIAIPPYQVRTPENLLDWRRMYDRIAEMDSQAGELLAELQDLGEEENTIIVYCSDHAGITLRSKRFLYDSGTRVPLIVRVPPALSRFAIGETGTASDRLVQFIDFPRTFLSLAGVEVPKHMPGRVFFGPGSEAPPETIFLFADRFDHVRGMSRGVTDGKWKYIRNFHPDRPRFSMNDYPLAQSGQVSQWLEFQAGRTDALQSAHYRPNPPEELYDTGSDPHEIRNLALEKSDAGVIERMREQLDKHILSARDTGFIPEPMIAAIDRDGAIHEFARSDERYPLAEILPVAKAASSARGLDREFLCGWLRSDNPIIRYWALCGFAAIGARAEAHREAITGAMEDRDPSVRIQAAIALGNIPGHLDEAVKALIREAVASDADIQTAWALDGLRYFDADDALAATRESEVSKGTYSSRAFRSLRNGLTMHRGSQALP